MLLAVHAPLLPPCFLEGLLQVEAGLFVCLPLLLLRLPLPPAQAWAVVVPVCIDGSLALAAAF